MTQDFQEELDKLKQADEEIESESNISEEEAREAAELLARQQEARARVEQRTAGREYKKQGDAIWQRAQTLGDPEITAEVGRQLGEGNIGFAAQIVNEAHQRVADYTEYQRLLDAFLASRDSNVGQKLAAFKAEKNIIPIRPPPGYRTK